MRVTRSQIVHGIADYIQSEITPKMGNGRALQILVSVGANAVAANNKLVDAIFANQMVRGFLDEDESGTYEISGLADAMSRAIQQYGSFPVQVPAIPLIAPAGMILDLTDDDVAAIKSRIESAI